MTTKKELEAALKACVDLLEDIRHGSGWPVSMAIENLHNYHPLIKKVGGFEWHWDSEEEEWVNKGH